MRLGVFDSGVGGLTVVERLRRRLPSARIVFFSDQAHVPYGDRSDAELQSLLRENLAVLSSCEVDAIVMGCNTTCAVGAAFGRPPVSVPVFDLIEAGAALAAESGARRFGVVATSATVRLHAYKNAIGGRLSECVVEETAAPALVPLIESGASPARLREAIRAALSGFSVIPEAVVLGCSHYPLVRDLFEAEAPGALVLDPAEMQARQVAAFAEAAGPRVPVVTEAGVFAWTNADPVAFVRSVERLGFENVLVSEHAPVVRAAAT